MNQEIAMKWADALESGDYNQCHGQLRARITEEGGGEYGYCCLGVLSELSKLAKWENNCYAGQQFVLPNPVFSWSGMHSRKGAFWNVEGGEVQLSTGAKYQALTDMNDAGVSFSEIAEVIRENWEKL